MENRQKCWRSLAADHPQDFEIFLKILTCKIPHDLKEQGVTDLPFPTQVVREMTEENATRLTEILWEGHPQKVEEQLRTAFPRIRAAEEQRDKLPAELSDMAEKRARQGVYHHLAMVYYQVNSAFIEFNWWEQADAIRANMRNLTRNGVPSALLFFLPANAWLAQANHPSMKRTLNRTNERKKDEIKKAENWVEKQRKSISDLLEIVGLPPPGSPFEKRYSYDTLLKSSIGSEMLLDDIDRTLARLDRIIEDELQHVKQRYKDWRNGPYQEWPKRGKATPQDIYKALEGTATLITECTHMKRGAKQKARILFDLWGVSVSEEAVKKERQRRR